MGTAVGLALVSLALFSSPLSWQPFCPASQVDVLVFHEWSHDAGFWARGHAPFAPWTVTGNKWEETQPGWRIASASGLVGETWLAAATLDPCTVRANTTSVGAYTLRALASPGNSGDFDPHRRQRNVFGAAVLLPALFIEGIVEFSEAGR